MDILIFVLLMAICMGIIYFVHRYFGKNEFYLLAIVYSIISFVMSFKIVHLLGIDVNLGIIFSSSLIMILYYFIHRYGNDDAKKVIVVMIVSTLICACLLMINAFMIPSLYDKMSAMYQGLILDNLAIVIIYPISLTITLFLCNYAFNELLQVKEKRTLRMILVLVGITFIDVFIFIYFSYAIIIRFDIAMKIAISNYLFKCLIVVSYFLIVDKLFMIRKVKK